MYTKSQLMDHGSVVSRTLGSTFTDTHESAFVSLRTDDSLTLPSSRPIADKLIGGVKKSFDPATGQYVDETAGEAN